MSVKPTLVARTFGGAIVAAQRQGNTLCRVTLTNGAPSFPFDLHDTIDDALVGNRPETQGIAALIPYHSIAMIEFGG